MARKLAQLISGFRLFDGDALKQSFQAVGTRTIIIPIPALSGLANSQTRKILVPFNFVVLSAGFRVGDPATTISKAATLTAQINGTAMTGGVIGLTSANCTPSGALVAGTAITGLAAGVDGNTLEVAVSAVTAFAEGSGWVEFTVSNT